MSQEKQNNTEEKALEKALSPVVNRLIDKNFENSGDKIASQIAPLIGGAIREQIKSQKDDIVDALYPVMGNMISKFVTKSLEELFNKINTQIQNGLSTQAIKRKIKAKIKGVSECDLLLQESSHAKIKAALLIHKESGILLTQAEDETNKLSDPDMLASMMTAIRSFVNDWISVDTPNNELGEIEYGGNKIIIEASGHSYLAVIVEGAAYTQTYQDIRRVLEKIVLKYGESIQSFQGNTQNIPIEKLQEILKTLLAHKKINNEKTNKTHPLIWILPLILIGWFGYLFYEDYIDKNLEKQVQQMIEQTPALTPYKINVNIKNAILTLKGKVPFVYHKNLLEKLVEKIDGINKLDNKVTVLPTLTDPFQVSNNIAYLLKGFNQIKNTHIGYKFDYSTLYIFGTLANQSLYKTLKNELQKIPGIENIKDSLKVFKPKIKTDIHFNTASITLNADAITKLTNIIQDINKSDTNATVLLQAYSDMIGDKKTNKLLAKKRLENIQNFLTQKNKLQNHIITKIYDIPPPGIDPQKNSYEARRIHISLQRNLP